MKRIFLIFAVCFFAVSAFSQDRFSLGLKVGFNSTKFTTDNPTGSGAVWSDIKDDAKASYLFGAFARLKLLGNVSLQPELYYTTKKGESKYEYDGDEYSYTTKLNSWDLPILVHLSVLDVKALKVYGITGPVVSFVSNSEAKLPHLGDVEEELKESVWNYQLGAGVEVLKFTFDVRYEWGLSNVSEGIGDVDITKKGNTLMFSLGYKLF